MIKSSLLVCLLALVASAHSQCVQDYECGNMPYAVCNGGVNECSTTVKGLGVDTSSNQIYFAQICRTSSKANNITIKKISSTGGVPSVVQTRQQIQGPANPDELFDVVGDYLYLSMESRSPGHLLATLNLNSLAQSDTVDTGAYFQAAIDFDTTARKTYVCNLTPSASSTYSIDSFSGILGQDSAATRSILYTLPLTESCTSVRVLGSDLYFSVLETVEGSTAVTSKVYKGSTTCDNCTTAATLLFSLAGTTITDFDVTSDRIYYGTTKGVFSTDFTGNNTVHISWSSGASGVRVLGSRVYWNSGVAIISSSLDGTGVTQLNQFSGSCGCRNGFAGTTCSTCSGQVQWLEGVPSCVAFNSDGNPETCNFDYECANSPFSYCAGSCQCRDGFGGTHCNSCTDSTKGVVWSGGIPSCH